MQFNHEGLRSQEIDSRTRVLCLGDSVTNGGILTDQSQTYPSLLEYDLKQAGMDVEVLNAGAGGWAPSNEEGFLRTKGTFGAKVVVLEIGTNDFWQEKAESSLVGTLSYPDHKPLLALTELVNRYLWPRIAAKVFPHRASEAYRPVNSAIFDDNLRIITAMIDESQHQGAKVELLIVPFADEIKPGYKDARDVDLARERIKTLCLAKHVTLIDSRPVLSQSRLKIYRDEVHPNEAGNKIMADELQLTVQKDLQ